MIRRMTNALEGWNFYRSSFDTEKGILIRDVEEPRGRHYESIAPQHLREQWDEKFSWERSRAFSPVPETIDVQITNYCTVGCPFCYQDSTGRKKHPDGLKLVRTIFEGLDQPPYQIAFGGGEPCQYPDFGDILRLTRELGAVPNFTTSGVALDENIAKAAREVCGGVALTFHRWRGVEKFRDAYTWWRERLPGKQLNVHLIVDKDVVPALIELSQIDQEAKVVLLAYYPSVGRASMKGLISHADYRANLPKLVQTLKNQGMSFAFSEGLLPWVLSHPEIGINTDFLGPQEGRYSCYVDTAGRVTHSSFSPPDDRDPSIFNKRFQDIWNKGWFENGAPGAPACYSCKHQSSRCSAPISAHTLLCEYQPHNAHASPPMNVQAVARRNFEKLLSITEEMRTELGRAPTAIELETRVLRDLGIPPSQILQKLSE